MQTTCSFCVLNSILLLWIYIWTVTPGQAILTMPAAINIRLVDGPDESEGRVEIQNADTSNSSKENPWGTICNDLFEDDNKAATVICRQLGYTWGEATGVQKYGQAATDVPLLLDELLCNGNESSLQECQHSNWGIHDCYHHEDVGVICHNHTVRLQTHAKQTGVGAVQVLYKYQWADVCDEGWNDTAATIVCRELGFVYGVAECCSALGRLEAAHVRPDHWDINWSFKYRCTGNESALTSCGNTRFAAHCEYSHRASVVCHNTTSDNVDMSFSVRLAEGDINWGRVEVRHSGIWGAVCSDKWDDAAANVTCRQLGEGFVGGIAMGPSRTVDMPFWLRDASCQGNETSLEQCSYTQWGEPVFFCSSAFVLCYKTTGVQLDIVDGALPSMGRVQITYDGVPGSICTEEWTDNDASLVCRMKGYGDGVVKTPTPPVHRPPYYLNRMICSTTRTNVFMCSTYGWRKKVDQCTESAHVTCYKKIRLTGGDEKAGIAEYVDGTNWVGFCNLGFKFEYAHLICQELGHPTGSLLPYGAYGKYYKHLGRPNINCTGNQTNIMDCAYDQQMTCFSSNYRYVAVCCHDDTPEEGPRYQLVGSVPAPSYGQVNVRMHHIWGEICSDGWSDTEADVFCKTQGRDFKGGVAIYDDHRRGVPVLVSQITCLGNETDFNNCVVGKYFICRSTKQAGALCYKESAPRMTLVGGGRNYGRVQISMDDVTGTVCKVGQRWNSDDASVICRQVNQNFTQGEFYSEFPNATGEVILRIESCTGLEKSVFECVKDGWRSNSPLCMNHKLDGGVYCYGKVRLVGGKKAANVITGRLEILPPRDAGDGDDWIPICGTDFDQQDAEVVCREMGYDNAKVLSPGSFGVKPAWRLYTNLTCKAGGNDVHSDCTYGKGVCSMFTHNYASVMCFSSDLLKDTKYYIEYGYHGRVIVEQYGINGTICAEGWDEVDANVVCRSQGYRGGVLFGSPEIYDRTMTIWASNVTCMGSETSLSECPQTDNVSIDCGMSIKTAGVLCYKKGVSVHLVNDDSASHYGRVEIEYDGERGTVCDYEWSAYDARVLCRQLGFPDGEAYKKAYYGQGNGSVVLSKITCDNTESTLLECPHLGWKDVHFKCKDHETDAGVRCKRNLMMDQAANYGAVKVWREGNYYLVCADGFTDNDAAVVCRNMGYSYGKSLCCDAFGDQMTRIGFSKSACTGREVSYSDCKKVVGESACVSKQYASVVCSREPPPQTFDVGIEEYVPGMGSGPVLIHYFNEQGYMCAEEFDDKDANVLCKQKGYTGGYAYKYYNEDVKLRATNDLRWFRGPKCNGDEHKLELCDGVGTPNVSGCFVLSHAAVFCYKNQAQSKFEVNLVNAPHPGEGYVQIKVNGTWGSICTHSNLISNFEATVVCRQLNFKYGVAIPIPNYPPLNGTVWLSNMNCVGTESSIRECLLSGMGDTVTSMCKTHSFDMAVKCYANVRVSASQTPNFGMVQVLNGTSNRWVSVCDTDFDDVDARVVCRNIGYADGKSQCCSSLGSKLTFYNPIEVVGVQCVGNETDFTTCKYTMGGDVKCPSGHYASVICTDTTPPQEDLKVSISDGRYFGNVKVTRYGVTGSVCDVGWDDKDADVLCRELGFVSGQATNSTKQATLPMLMTSVNCTGKEKKLSECQYPDLNAGHECNGRLTRAAALCSMTSDPVQYRIADLKNGRGRPEILVNGRWGTICDLFWEDQDADVFCRQAGQLGGESTVLVTRGTSDMPIWMSHVECTGKETDFLQCRMTWDTASRCTHYDDAGVKCYSSARLNRGDYRSTRTNGIVEVFIAQTDPYANSWFTVCADTFTDKEAEVVCNVLGHDHGMAVCCSPYGYNTSPMSKLRPRCHGNETQVTDCQLVKNETVCSRQDYASVTCYSGERTTQTAYSLGLKGSLKYTGQVVLKYMGVPGRICWTGWSDEDARVVCRELGFRNGSAYYHYKSSFIYLDYNGPYWTSEVKCIGNESQLRDCPHVGFGNVTQCHDRGHYAGVICFDETDVAYRIAGGDARYGRVEFTYDGSWHTICSNTWGSEEANVTCKQLGFVTGDKYSGEYNESPAGKAYSINFRCKGDEYNLNNCPHEGLQEATYCQDHKDDEGVFCYTSVKLSGPQGLNSGNGSVLYYLNDTWTRVCDEGFDDVTARRVCKELGFADGRSICCSAFGGFSIFDEELSNYSLSCKTDDAAIESCLVHTECATDTYASAICFKEGQKIDEETYTFELEKKPDQGQVLVTHMGVAGRICSRDWDDKDATVLCRSKGYMKGLSYQHSEGNVLREKRGPYWLGGFNCTGNESTLNDCPRLNRTNLDNCTEYDIAAVLCYNESGINYRLQGGSDHYGRVEVQIGGEWGTVCDQYWDKREAAVFCRQQNFTDGEAIGRAHFGRGTGPIWISHLECTGKEDLLHQCPHRGFANEYTFDWWFPLPCETHADDAGVFCYKSVRFNTGPNVNAGGLEIHRDGKWYGVCDSGFTKTAAIIACKSIRKDFIDATVIPGSAYGNISGEIGFSHVTCNGTEDDIASCTMTFNDTCDSGYYVSAYCSNKTIVDKGVKFRVAMDSLSSKVHGIIEARVKGIWGRVCLHNFDDRDATVACRHFGFDGGVAYLHIMKNDRPVLVRDVRCNGTESSLEQCPYEHMTPDLEHCHYGSNDAGVICYNTTDGVGFEYRLNGGSSEANGRVEIGYAGRWGMVCAWSWQTADASVLCRALGYKDGIVNYTKNESLRFSIPWVTGFFCQGDESSPMTCLNTGFNSTFLTDLCMGGRDPGAYSQCFKDKIAPVYLRLANGPNNHTGRVEIYVKGANQWGTICDDYWDEDDAVVVCRQLGLYGGTALRKAPFGAGTGPIWYDNVKCVGNETSLFNCSHRGLGTHNCNHTEDVGVVCEVTPPTTAVSILPTKTTPTPTTLKPVTTKTTTTSTTTTPTTRKPTTKAPVTTATTKKPPVSTTTSTTTKITTTPKPITPKPTIPRPPTTQLPVTPEQTTTTTSSSKLKTTTIKPATTEETTKTINVTVASQVTSSSKANLGVIVAVPLVVIMVIAVIVVVVFMKCRRGKWPGYSREHFDESVINREPDGTVTASNQLYDLNLTPTSPDGLSDVASPGEHDNMMLGRNGTAHYSKGMSNGDSNTSAFTNPLYEANKDMEPPIEGQNGVAKTLPANGEIASPDNGFFGGHTNA